MTLYTEGGKGQWGHITAGFYIGLVKGERVKLRVWVLTWFSAVLVCGWKVDLPFERCS